LKYTVRITERRSKTHYISNKTHRDGLTETCPHCWDQTDAAEWLKAPHLIEIVTDEPNFGDNYPDTPLYDTRLIAVSTCPKCGEKSWAHWRFSSFEVRHESKWPEPKELYPYDLRKLSEILTNGVKEE